MPARETLDLFHGVITVPWGYQTAGVAWGALDCMGRPDAVMG